MPTIEPWKRWTLLVQNVMRLAAGGRAMFIGYGEGNGVWGAVAVESIDDSRVLKPETFQADAARFLGDHAHETLGPFKTEAACKRACERWARDWYRRRTKLAPCACGPIAKAGTP